MILITSIYIYSYVYIYIDYIATFLLIHNHTFSHPRRAIAQDALRRRMEAALRGTVEWHINGHK